MQERTSATPSKFRLASSVSEIEVNERFNLIKCNCKKEKKSLYADNNETNQNQN